MIHAIIRKDKAARLNGLSDNGAMKFAGLFETMGIHPWTFNNPEKA